MAAVSEHMLFFRGIEYVDKSHLFQVSYWHFIRAILPYCMGDIIWPVYKTLIFSIFRWIPILKFCKACIFITKNNFLVFKDIYWVRMLLGCSSILESTKSWSSRYRGRLAKALISESFSYQSKNSESKLRVSLSERWSQKPMSPIRDFYGPQYGGRFEDWFWLFV